MDYNENILDKNFPLKSIIIHGTPVRLLLEKKRLVRAHNSIVSRQEH